MESYDKNQLIPTTGTIKEYDIVSGPEYGSMVGRAALKIPL